MMGRRIHYTQNIKEYRNEEGMLKYVTKAAKTFFGLMVGDGRATTALSWLRGK